MSSIAGVKVFAPGGTVYSGTKFAARAISDGLRLEVGPKIRVCSIEPGSIAGIATLEGAAGNT
jgi:NADP-dependent 3-hydroxy acid dehydrogenase YdfG